MANVVKVRYRGTPLSAGRDQIGVGTRKQEIRGRIEVTNYDGQGEDLKPHHIGLSYIDFICLKLNEPLTSSDPSEQWRKVDYSHGAQQFYIVEVGQTGVALNLTRSKDPTLTFSAFGESAHDVELL